MEMELQVANGQLTIIMQWHQLAHWHRVHPHPPVNFIFNFMLDQLEIINFDNLVIVHFQAWVLWYQIVHQAPRQNIVMLINWLQLVCQRQTQYSVHRIRCSQRFRERYQWQYRPHQVHQQHVPQPQPHWIVHPVDRVCLKIFAINVIQICNCVI